LSPRPQIDHIRKPQILAAAADVIADRGVAATRIADIAERARTSPPAVLYWFDSKDDLLAEALTLDEERFHSVLADRLSALEHPRDRLRLLIGASAGEYDMTLWMEIWTRALRDATMRKARQRLDEGWRDEIERIVRAGQEAGEFAAVNPREAAIVIASVLDGLAVQTTLGDPSVSAERMGELAIRVAELLLECELPPLEPERLLEFQAALRADGAASPVETAG
jgi:AcrR family transcriptional regulator